MNTVKDVELIYKNVHFSLNFITGTFISPLEHSCIHRSNVYYDCLDQKGYFKSKNTFN